MYCDVVNQVRVEVCVPSSTGHTHTYAACDVNQFTVCELRCVLSFSGIAHTYAQCDVVNQSTVSVLCVLLSSGHAHVHSVG